MFVADPSSTSLLTYAPP